MMLSSVFKAVRHHRVRVDASLPLFSAAKSLFSSEANGPVVRFKDVSFAHPGSPNELLDSADFSITKGENLVNITVDCCGNCNLPFSHLFSVH
jgi:ABC-type transport system involved in cytochrome bd biosynthesis fused ATPase/permease subunit